MKSTTVAVLVAVSLLSAGCSKGSQTNTTSSTTTTSATQAPKQTAAVNGGTVYQTNCSSCHGADGKGSPGAFPPLAQNAFVTGAPGSVIHVVKNGLSGPVKIGTQTYNGQMPAWSGTLNADQIAAVITHIRTSWGNKAPAVTAAQVAAAK